MTCVPGRHRSRVGPLTLATGDPLLCPALRPVPVSQGALQPVRSPHASPRHPRLDPLADRYAARTHGMKTSEIRALFSVVSRPEVVSLAGGMPAVTALPLDAVGSMIGDLVSGMGAQTLQYGSGQGDPRLRERICDVMALEGITDASPSEVVVTVGSQQGLDLVTRVFVDPGDVILAEAPSYVGALGRLPVRRGARSGTSPWTTTG